MNPNVAWSASFPPDLESVARARAGVGDALGAAGVAPLVVADATAVLSELASNAARHARTEFTVAVVVEQEKLRLEVSDRDTRPPSLLGLDFESTSGRGLHIVASLAADWGWRTAEDSEGVSGKVVWAEFSLTAPETEGEGR
jgi:anti-sigma regulatory factor (Ser/Thr protein kinase)